jgi:cation:H+ antiporter
VFYLVQSAVFALGIALLVGGAWVLIRGGSLIARILGVPPVIVGLTVVAFGTSAPELFVSIVGAARGNAGLVLGNVIGSNVANLGLILAAAAVLRPVIVERGLIKREVPLLLAASLVLTVLAWDGSLGRLDSLVLVLGFAGFMFWTIRHQEEGRRIVPTDPVGPPVDPGHRLRQVSLGFGMVLLGVAGLAGGGHFIVSSALALATSLGVSETLVGLTLVAVGTSLPELATTIVAALQDEDDMALGNIVGSNLFNILAVAGPVGLAWTLTAEEGGLPFAAGPVESPIQVQLLSMMLVTLAVTLMISRGRGRIGRVRGAVLLALYAGVMTLWTLLR